VHLVLVDIKYEVRVDAGKRIVIDNGDGEEDDTGSVREDKQRDFLASKSRPR
jgi:hypothetical protein